MRRWPSTDSPSQRVAVSSESHRWRYEGPDCKYDFHRGIRGRLGNCRKGRYGCGVALIASYEMTGSIGRFSRKSRNGRRRHSIGGYESDTPVGTVPGPSVAIVTDLATVAFLAGTLTGFSWCSNRSDSAPQSSFSFDAGNHDQINWTPTGVTIPPFRYQITYLYPGNTVAQSSGTSSNLTLILYPPPAPA
jgi:hypothetical protein